MSLFATILVQAEEEHHIDRTHSWILPETPEIIYGGIGFLVVVALFWKLGVFKMIGKALTDRTAKIQGQLDESAAARRSAETEASEIRKAAGDIESERARLFADADAQAEQVLAEGRSRLDAEIADLQARADAEIAGAGSRSGDELRGEISRLAGAAAERLVGTSLDDATQQRLIEDFISKVGATRA